MTKLQTQILSMAFKVLKGLNLAYLLNFLWYQSQPHLCTATLASSQFIQGSILGYLGFVLILGKILLHSPTSD